MFQKLFKMSVKFSNMCFRLVNRFVSTKIETEKWERKQAKAYEKGTKKENEEMGEREKMRDMVKQRMSVRVRKSGRIRRQRERVRAKETKGKEVYSKGK